MRVLASRREEKNPFSEEEISQLVEKIVDAVGRPNPDPEVLEDTWRKETRRLVIDKGLEEMLFDIVSFPLPGSLCLCPDSNSGAAQGFTSE